MYAPYPENMMESIKKVEATRAERMATEPRRLTAEEKDALLEKFHPDYNPNAFAEIKVGPNKGQNELKTCLACQTKVEEGMYVASIPFFPTDKRTYNIEELQPNQQVMMELYPEIYSCIGCNACTKACTQDLNVMQYIAYAQRGELEKCAEESFDCVSCGCCSVRCPAGISHPMVGLLARRLTGKYIAPKSEHLEKRVEEIHEGKYDDLIEQIMQKPITDMQELYNNREIEK